MKAKAKGPKTRVTRNRTAAADFQPVVLDLANFIMRVRPSAGRSPKDRIAALAMHAPAVEQILRHHRIPFARDGNQNAITWHLIHVLEELEKGGVASMLVLPVSGGDEPLAAGADAPLAAPPPVEPPVPSDRAC